MKTAPKRAVVIQPREEKDLGRSYSTFQYVKGARKKRTNLLGRACCNRRDDNDFKLKEGTFRL